MSETAAPRSALDAFGEASPSGGADLQLSNEAKKTAEAQNRADAKRDAVAAFGEASPSTVAPPAPPPVPSFIHRAWSSLKDIPGQIVKDLTPTAPHIPGTSEPEPLFADNAPMAEPHFAQGLVRGARDVIDTGAHGLATSANAQAQTLAAAIDTLMPGNDTVANIRAKGLVDVDAMRENDRKIRQEWEDKYGNAPMASVGRTIGQIGATAGPVGAIGRTVTAGARLIPGAVGDAARFLTGGTGLAAPRAGQAAPSLATRLAARAGQISAQGAGTGAVQSGLTSSGYDEPIEDQIVRGAATGAVLAPAIGTVTRGYDAARGYVTGIRPDVAELAATADRLGVTPPMSAMATNPQLKQFSSAMQSFPGSGADAAALAKQRQFQSGVTRQMGSTADNLSPATMQETATRLSRGYNDLFANAPPVVAGPTLRNEVANVGADASQYLVGDQAGAMAHVGNAIQRVNAAFARGGQLDAQAYKSLMGREDGALARIEDAAPSAAQPYLARIRDAVQARFAASAGPEAAARLNQLDRQWRAMKTVEPMAEVSTMGDIGPGGYLQKVVNQSRKYDSSTGGIAYTGGGEEGDLGRVGKQFFGHIPDSGTAARLQGYEFAKNPISYIMTAIPGISLGRAIQIWNNSPGVARNAINVARGGPIPDATRLVPSGLLGPIDYQRDRAGP